MFLRDSVLKGKYNKYINYLMKKPKERDHDKSVMFMDQNLNLKNVQKFLPFLVLTQASQL